MNAATAAVTMMAITLVRLALDGFVVLALGFEDATRGRFLARSIFLCRLVGTRGNLLSTFFSGKVFIQYSCANVQSAYTDILPQCHSSPSSLNQTHRSKFVKLPNPISSRTPRYSKSRFRRFAERMFTCNRAGSRVCRTR